MKNNKKNVLIVMICILISTVIIFIACSLINKYMNKEYLVEYASDLLEFDLRDAVVSSNGRLSSKLGEEDYLYAEFIIAEDKESKVRNWISNNSDELDESIINTYIDFAKRNKDSSMKYSPAELNLEYFYEIMESGKYARTRDIMIFLCTDNNGVMYLYIYG